MNSKAVSDATHRLMRLYAALIECDQAIIRSKNRADLFENICRHMGQLGGLSFAWIGMVEVGGTTVWPQAHYGEGWNYFEFMQMATSLEKLPRRGPADLAIQENRAVWCDDILNDPQMESRWEIAKAKGWHSAGALPLTVGGAAMGVFAIYAHEVKAFDAKARDLLVQLASNISYALDHFELDAQRRQVEYALQESEVRYSALFASSSIPMLLIDPSNGHILDANIKAVNFYGWDYGTLITKKVSDINIMSPDEIRTEMAHAVSTHKSHFDFRHRVASGAVLDVEVFSNPISFSGETYLISVVHDVTEQRRLEARVRNAKLLLQRFIDQVPGTAFVKDGDLRILMANKKLGDLLGLAPQALIGKTAHEVLPAAFADMVTQFDQLVLDKGGNHVFQEAFNNRHSEISLFAMDDDSGDRFLGGLSFDITDRYRASERSDALLRINEMGSQLPEAEFLTAGLELAEQLTRSKMGFLHFVNDDQETLELVTWTSATLKGCTAAFDSHYPASQAGIWADCLRTKTPAVFNDYPGYVAKKGLPEGHVPLARLISVPIIENGKVRLMLGVGNKDFDYDDFDTETLLLLGNDLWRIARRLRVEAALVQRVEDLVVANKKLSDVQLQLLQSEKMASIGQLASGVAHEINNPIGFVKSNLGSLAGYVENIVEIIQAYEAAESQLGESAAAAFTAVRTRKKALDYDYVITDLAQLITESRDGVQRVSKIVMDLKNFSRSGDGTKEWCDLHAGIESTINVVWNQLKYKVQLDRVFATLPQIHCIASQINQVVMNLLVNAGQAIGEKGHITIRTGTEGESVWFEVQDDGCGISEENQTKIFEPFYTSKPVGQGTGLGLSISFGIVQRHGGHISVQSAPGHGSTFRVTLPINGPQEIAP